VAPLDNSSSYDAEPVTREHRSLLEALRRRWLILVLVPILTGAAAAAFAYASYDTYESTAKLLFRQTVPPELNAAGVIPNSPDAEHLANSNVEVVGSRRVAESTSQELQRRGVDLSPEDVQEDVSVSTDEATDVVDVVAKADSPERAALLATVYSDTAARLAQRQEQARAARNLRIAEEYLDSLTPREAQFSATFLRTSINSLRILARGGSGSPEVIQSGYVPTSKSGNPLQTVLLGVLFGLVLGIGLALLREQADRRLHQAEDVSAAFGAPVLTTVPRSRALKKHVAFDDLPPDVAEAFRMLYVNLRFSPSEPVRSVLVTSSRSREGKTTVAWHLAAAAASGGLAVALVEADLRRPSLAQRHNLRPTPGLGEVLSDDLALVEALQRVPSSGNVGPNGRPGRLEVLVAGGPSPDPWALMHSPAMTRTLDLLKRNHDLVILDTPPIPHVADAVSLLRRVGGVIVTASVRSTKGPEAERLRDQLATLDARILGVVANGGSAATGYAYAPPARPPGSSGGGADGRPDSTAELPDVEHPRHAG
jgi:capsular exopolysaccharide synthesis family protein